MGSRKRRSIGVLTSGGDAPGMNAAVRAVVRTGLDLGVDVYAICEGYQGMVEGGELIRRFGWDDVGGILHRGGTAIGTARSDAYRTREGRLDAAQNLVERGIEAVVVIGGDGSLTGADVLREEWPSLLEELVENERIRPNQAKAHRRLTIVGVVGSIDNDMQGTDTTIGADSALHRIQEDIDALGSTAASHQRTFVVEVMGRHCGYLALMSGLAASADWVLIPESPPDVEDWEALMCERLAAGRKAGRRASTVVIAEGAIDRKGNPISAAHVKKVLTERLGLEVRETILGHVQRGGSPSAFDRNMSTIVGHAAVEEAISKEAEGEARMIGFHDNRVVRRSLMECVEETREVGQALKDLDFHRVMTLRGESFRDAFRTLKTLVRALPHDPVADRRRMRIGVLHAGAPAPGMNMAVRVAVRLGADKGHTMLGIQNGFRGLADGDIVPLDWMAVNGWGMRGGAELGTNSHVPDKRDYYAIAKQVETHEMDALLVIGGLAGYEAAHRLWEQRETFPAFDCPILCMPASIDNNLPGSEVSVGADTALNSIARNVDAIKQSAVASRRAFVVEVMGNTCGYLALMSGLATGAERVYLPEEGVTLRDLEHDVQCLNAGFRLGKRVGLMIRNETANPIYGTDFMTALFEEEGGDLFEVRKAILGHVQQGGDPAPFDRILATRFATRCVHRLDELGVAGASAGEFVGIQRGAEQFHDLRDFPRMVDREVQRPVEQWWLAIRPIARLLAQPAAQANRLCAEET